MNNYVSLESHRDYVEESERRYDDLETDYLCLKEDYEELKRIAKKTDKANHELGIIVMFQLILMALLIFL